MGDYRFRVLFMLIIGNLAGGVLFWIMSKNILTAVFYWIYVIVFVCAVDVGVHLKGAIDDEDYEDEEKEEKEKKDK